MSQVIGYLRVSTNEQDLEKNKADIFKLANEKDLGRVEVVEEKVSGVQDWRKRKIGETLGSLSAGDTIIVSELSRLGRSTLQILEIMQVCKERDIAVYAVKGAWSFIGTRFEYKRRQFTTFWFWRTYAPRSRKNHN